MGFGSQNGRQNNENYTEAIVIKRNMLQWR